MRRTTEVGKNQPCYTRQFHSTLYAEEEAILSISINLFALAYLPDGGEIRGGGEAEKTRQLVKSFAHTDGHAAAVFHALSSPTPEHAR